MRSVHVWSGTLASLLCSVASHAVPAGARPPGARDDAASIARFLAASETPLTHYRAFRTLEAVTRGGRMRGRLTACTWLDPQRGFHYEVQAEDGAGIIRSKVLRAALEAERAMRASGEVANGALTPANYAFALDTAADAGLVRIALRPKRRDTLLVNGSMLVTAADADLVRIEGTLSKRPSFWTRRVEVVRRYARLNGVRVPVDMQSTAQVLFVGASSFSMVYDYETINGQAVSAPARSDRCGGAQTSAVRAAAPP